MSPAPTVLTVDEYRLRFPEAASHMLRWPWSPQPRSEVSDRKAAKRAAVPPLTTWRAVDVRMVSVDNAWGLPCPYPGDYVAACLERLAIGDAWGGWAVSAADYDDGHVRLELVDEDEARFIFDLVTATHIAGDDLHNLGFRPT